MEPKQIYHIGEVPDVNPPMEIQQQNPNLSSSSQRVNSQSLDNDKIHLSENSQLILTSQKQTSPRKSQAQVNIPLQTGEEIKGTDSQKSNKSNKNPMSTVFRNDEVHQATAYNQNERKFSDTFGPVGISNIDNFQGEVPDVNPPMEIQQQNPNLSSSSQRVNSQSLDNDKIHLSENSQLILTSQKQTSPRKSQAQVNIPLQTGEEIKGTDSQKSNKSNKNPMSTVFRNDEVHQATAYNQNERKFSDTFGPVGISNIDNFQGEVPDVNPPMEIQQQNPNLSSSSQRVNSQSLDNDKIHLSENSQLILTSQKQTSPRKSQAQVNIPLQTGEEIKGTDSQKSNKSNKNPMSTVFRNDEVHQATAYNQNERKFSDTFGPVGISNIDNFQGEVPDVNPPMEIQQQNPNLSSSSQRVNSQSLDNDKIHLSENSQLILTSQKQTSPRKSQAQVNIPLQTGEEIKGTDSQKSNKSNKNPMSTVFRNDEVHQATAYNQNERKFSDTFGPVGISNIDNFQGEVPDVNPPMEIQQQNPNLSSSSQRVNSQSLDNDKIHLSENSQLILTSQKQTSPRKSQAQVNIPLQTGEEIKGTDSQKSNKSNKNPMSTVFRNDEVHQATAYNQNERKFSDTFGPVGISNIDNFQGEVPDVNPPMEIQQQNPNLSSSSQRVNSQSLDNDKIHLSENSQLILTSQKQTSPRKSQAQVNIPLQTGEEIKGTDSQKSNKSNKNPMSTVFRNDEVHQATAYNQNERKFSDTFGPVGISNIDNFQGEVPDVNPPMEIQQQNPNLSSSSQRVNSQSLDNDKIHLSENSQLILTSQKQTSPRKSQAQVNIPLQTGEEIKGTDSQKSNKSNKNPMSTVFRNDEVHQATAYNQNERKFSDTFGPVGISNIDNFQGEVPDVNPPMEIQQQNPNLSSSSQRVNSQSLDNDKIHLSENSQLILTSQKQTSPRKSQAQVNIPLQTGEEIKGTDSQKSNKSNKNPMSTVFRNDEVHQATAYNQNERKFSDTFRSAVLSNFDNTKSSVRKYPKSLGLTSLQYSYNQDEYKLSNMDQLVIIQKPSQPLSILKKGSVNNCFSNRSQSSHRSNRSNQSRQSNSSYRYNRFVDTMQVPQLTSLQVVKKGRQSRVERRSSASSHQSRSASTCKKSYDDFGEIHMQKIDQSACQQLDQKSVKRSVVNPTKSKIFIMNEISNQQFKQKDNQSRNDGNSQTILKQTTQQFVYSKYIKSQQQKSESRNKYSFAVQRSNQDFSSFNQNSIKLQNQANQNLIRQTICHEVSFQYYDGKQPLEQCQFDNKSIQVDQISQIYNKTTSSQKIRQQNQRITLERQNKIQRLYLTTTYNITIESGLQKDERFEKLLQFCSEFISNSQNLSNFGRSRFKQMILKHFQIFGMQLNPINDIGQRLFHDGLFANSYIMYVKGSRNNSGMVESMLYSQFQQQIKILTNRQFFLKEYRRVREERQMHYQNQFQKRIKQYESKKQNEQAQRLNSLQAKMAQMDKKIKRPQQKLILHDKKVDTKDLQKNQIKKQPTITPNVSRFLTYEPNSQSNISVENSNDTVTVQDIDDVVQNSIRRSAAIETLYPNQSIPEKNQDLNIEYQDFEKMTETLQTKQKKKQQAPKKVQKSKKRYTKKKQNKKSQKKLVQKEQQISQNVQQTISQVYQVPKTQLSKEKVYKNQESNEFQQNDNEPEKLIQMKGILKSSRQVKEDQKQKKKPSNRLSVENKQQSKLSPGSKNQSLKNSSKETPKSRQKEQQNSRQKKNMKVSTDIDDSDYSESFTLKSKVSMEKKKKTQSRVVKFTNSTKGGDSPYMSRMKNETQLSQNQDNKEDKFEEKRKTRSRSKK